MPRRNSIPGHCLHKKTGQGYVRLNGRFFYTGEFGTPQAEQRYNELIADWLSAGRPKDFAPADRPENDRFTVVELCAAYLSHAQHYYVKNGQQTKEVDNVKSALRHVNKVAGDMAADDFGPVKLKAVRQSMIDAGWCRKYINKQVSRVRTMFGWGVENELIPADVATALRYVKGLAKGKSAAKERAPVLPVDADTVNATLIELDDTLAAMVRLQQLTGARPGEICQMQPNEIDRTEDVWLYRPKSHKTDHHGHTRVIAIGPKAQNVLRPFLLRPANTYCFQPRRSHCDHYRPNAYYKRVRAAAKRAGLPPWGPNRLRHTAATEIRRKFDLESTRTVLGHSASATTEIYAQKDIQRAMEVARRIG